FATIAAKTLVVQHLRVAEFLQHIGGLSAAQRVVLQKAVAQLGPGGVDWQSAMKRELEIPVGLNPQAAAALAQIRPSYLNTLNNPSELPVLEKMIANAPPPLPDIIPNPKRVLEEKQGLTETLLQARSSLR